jgi:hypothetical protein
MAWVTAEYLHGNIKANHVSRDKQVSDLCYGNHGGKGVWSAMSA